MLMDISAEARQKVPLLEWMNLPPGVNDEEALSEAMRRLVAHGYTEAEAAIALAMFAEAAAE